MPIRRFSDHVDDVLNYLAPVHTRSSNANRKVIAKAAKAMDGDLNRLPPVDKGAAINAMLEQLGLRDQVRAAPSYAGDSTAQALASLAALGALVDPANKQNQTSAPAPIATVLADQSRHIAEGDVDLSWSAPASAQVTKSSAVLGPDGQPMGPPSAARMAILAAHAAYTVAKAVVRATAPAAVAKAAPAKVAPVAPPDAPRVRRFIFTPREGR